MELLAFALSVICVWLNARGHLATWPLAIASSVVYGYVFATSKLFGDAALQLVFIILAIYGWVCWKPQAHFTRSVTDIPVAIAGWLVGLSLFLYGIIYFILANYTNSDVPHTDAFLTSLSLIATFMSAQKWRQNWFVWAFTDTMYVGLYIYKQLWITALLYGLFVILCLLGWQQWTQSMNEQP